jgi:peptidoglycan/LPS O-acetylase OafA/YrhL
MTGVAVGQSDTVDIKPQRFGHRHNAFGFLRLLFASLVIVAHTPEIYDGDRSREILTRIFGTISFGDLAVDGFFVISGYLITSSYLASSSWRKYALKRIARIYPGFIVATAICIFVVAPIGGASLALSARDWVSVFVRALALQEPDIGTVFPGTYYGVLDGSMWTIAYEFKCYILVLLLGLAGVLSRRNLVLVLTFAILVLSTAMVIQGAEGGPITPAHAPTSIFGPGVVRNIVLANLHQTVRLMAVFMTGACYFLFRDNVRFTRAGLLVAFAALAGCLFVGRLANLGAAIFGGYLILATAKWAVGGVLERVNNENDISYGVYLYAWPVTKLLLHWWPEMPMLGVGVAALAVSCGCGWLSYKLVEQPAMEMVRRRRVALA